MGADPLHKDVFVEIDSMPWTRPSNQAMRMVVDAFARAPVLNPDGQTGINLHIDNGPRSLMNPRTGQTWGQLSRASEIPGKPVFGSRSGSKYSWTAFDAVKARFFERARRGVFHYALSVYGLPDPGGIGGGTVIGTSRSEAGSGGSDFITALRSCASDTLKEAVLCRSTLEGIKGSTLNEAANFMHELGHNLGLQHGGFEDTPYKPNHLSVMNYSYSLTGPFTLPPGCSVDAPACVAGFGAVLDYSRFRPPPGSSTPVDVSDATPSGTVSELDTQNLEEPRGLEGTGDAYRWVVSWWCNDRVQRFLMNRPIDWDCSGRIEPEPVIAEPHDGPAVDAGIGFLRTPFEWGGIVYDGGSIGEVDFAGPLTTDASERVSRATLQRAASTGSGDTRKPGLKVSVAGPVLQVSARDRAGLDQVVLFIDRARKEILVSEGKRRLRLRVRIGRGRHQIAVLAIDEIGNAARRILRAR